jgi:catechol 2,3-dioxygenase-like lactoylglutathione lyase family enzyme
MFKSNHCVAIHLKDLAAAELFYTNVMKFKLLTKSDQYLEYDTGHFCLYINQDEKAQPPIPSLNVDDLVTAKKLLIENGCVILREDRNSLYFRDPFGMVYDVVQGK